MNYVSLINSGYFGVINFHLQGKERRTDGPWMKRGIRVISHC